MSTTTGDQIHSTKSAFKRKLARSYALSRLFNPRNIEYDWYPLWAHVFFDMVAGDTNLILFPQFAVWISPEEDEADLTKRYTRDEGPEDPPSPKLPPRATKVKAKLAMKQQLAMEALYDDDNSFSAESFAPDSHYPSAASNPSAQSHGTSSSQITQGTDASGVTIALPQGLPSRIPDFAIIKLIEKNPPSPNLNRRYKGVEIEKVEVKLLVELKRFVSRSLPFDDPNDHSLAEAIEGCLTAAYDELLEQAALTFLKFPGLEHIRAIVACGDYWQTTKVTPANIPEAVYSKLGVGNYNPEVKAVEWSNLGTVEDNIEELIELSTVLRAS